MPSSVVSPNENLNDDADIFVQVRTIQVDPGTYKDTFMIARTHDAAMDKVFAAKRIGARALPEVGQALHSHVDTLQVNIRVARKTSSNDSGKYLKEHVPGPSEDALQDNLPKNDGGSFGSLGSIDGLQSQEVSLSKKSNDDSITHVRIKPVCQDEEALNYYSNEEVSQADGVKRLVGAQKISLMSSSEPSSASATLRENQGKSTTGKAPISMRSSEDSIIHVRIKPVHQEDQVLCYHDSNEEDGQAVGAKRLILANRISLTSDSESTSASTTLREKHGKNRTDKDKQKKIHADADSDTVSASPISYDSVHSDDEDVHVMSQPDFFSENHTQGFHSMPTTMEGTHQKNDSKQGTRKIKSGYIFVKENIPSPQYLRQDTTASPTDASKHFDDNSNIKPSTPNQSGNKPSDTPEENQTTKSGRNGQNVVNREFFRPAKFQIPKSDKDYTTYPRLRQLPFFARVNLPRRWGQEDVKKKRALKGMSCPPYHGYSIDTILHKSVEYVKRYYYLQDCSLDGSNWVFTRRASTNEHI